MPLKQALDFSLGDTLALTLASSYHTGLSLSAPSGDMRLTWLFVPYAVRPCTALLRVSMFLFFASLTASGWFFPSSEGAS